MTLPSAYTCLGSSPPTRGTRSCSVMAGGHGRFIPAHAGNTLLFRNGRRPRTVHPRPRGEHDIRFFSTDGVRGSSPPTRGTRNNIIETGRNKRFIPAHAGNTAREKNFSHRYPVHPRPRGEHRALCPQTQYWFGSSPPTRGTPKPPLVNHLINRFIPAHAGNTSRPEYSETPAPVHPRPRGEHGARVYFPPSIAGSSPPTRGTLVSHFLPLFCVRFIPAHAGNTRRIFLFVIVRPVHPRPRGEHLPSFFRKSIDDGSSPPTRGTPLPKK